MPFLGATASSFSTSSLVGGAAGILKPSTGDLAKWVRERLNEDQLIGWAIGACYGNPESPESFISHADKAFDSKAS
jgi:hypothetical protein